MHTGRNARLRLPAEQMKYQKAHADTGHDTATDFHQRMAHPFAEQLVAGGARGQAVDGGGLAAHVLAQAVGIDHPAFGVAVTLAFIVMIDANSLRQHVGRQAAAINRLASGAASHKTLRERMGHTLVEIGGGIVTGIGMGFLIHSVFSG